MRYVLVFCLLIFSFPARGFEIPEKAFVKSATRSFNHQFDVAVIEGRIWYRQKPESGANASRWELLGKTGLPEEFSSLSGESCGFDPPPFVTGLSTDGDNLIATGSDDCVYYMKWSTRRWTNKWGKPFSERLILPEKIRSWSVSHRGPTAGGYHDIDGNFHPVSVGVTTLYVLSKDGLNIRYADPWLRAGFSHEICGPERNRFRARSLDASASTIFVINDAGEMYTRLADYDTMGNNPFLDYSYERKVRDIPREKDVRTLPPEEWKKQPPISKNQGKISSAITIIQTGRGNESRELRVEGVNAQGFHGYFSKPINAKTWTFTRTDLPLLKPLLSSDNADPDPGPNPDQALTGHLWTGRLFNKHKYKADLLNFNPLCSGGILMITLGTDKLDFPFLTTATSQADRRMKGAIILPKNIKRKAVHNRDIEELINRLFRKKTFVEIQLNIDENHFVCAQSLSPFSLLPDVKMNFFRKI